MANSMSALSISIWEGGSRAASAERISSRRKPHPAKQFRAPITTGTPAPRSQLAALDAKPRHRGSAIAIFGARHSRVLTQIVAAQLAHRRDEIRCEGPGADGQAEPLRGLHAVWRASLSQSLALLVHPEMRPRQSALRNSANPFQVPHSAVRFRSGTAVRKVPAC